MEVAGRGDNSTSTNMSMLRVRVGDFVRGAVGYEPILGFLHVMPEKEAMYLVITHMSGKFRASPNHLVFIAVEDDAGYHAVQVSEVQVGDMLLANHGEVPKNPRLAGAFKPTLVLAVTRATSAQGMYAPLTSSGTIVVDGVLASIYADPNWLGGNLFSHKVMHGFFYPYRTYRLAFEWAFGHSSNFGAGAGLTGPEHREYMHPYIRWIVALGRLLFEDELLMAKEEVEVFSGE